jgi:uncharacterized protein (DUF1810 family)
VVGQPVLLGRLVHISFTVKVVTDEGATDVEHEAELLGQTEGVDETGVEGGAGGVAGLAEADVAPLFECCRDVDNISLPASFWDIIGEPSAREYDLDRFLAAQEADYANALDDMRHGRKRGHWIWYIFPQQKGLGHSYNSEYYGLEGLDEARAYLAHPVLGARLREISEALLTHAGKRDIDDIMGSSIDVLKLQTCMNLFNKVSPNDVFEKVLDAFF